MDVASIVTQTTSISQGTRSSSSQSTNSSELSVQEQQKLQKLKTRDQTVRAHEAAHMTAGGTLVKGGPSYTYQKGPDGKQYAIGGEVNIDTSEVSGDPQATLNKAQQIRSAALAPAQPSSQDRVVAAKATQMAVQARAEIRNQAATPSATATQKMFESSSEQNNHYLDFTV